MTLGILEISSLGLVLERPLAAALYALPLAVLLLSLRRDQPREVLVGTARFFPRDEAASGSRTARRLTPDRIAAIAALTCAITALLGPRPAPEEHAREAFALLVDRSPSMYLEHDPKSGRADRRIDVAIEAALAALGERAGDLDIVWLDGEDEVGTGAQPPPELLEPPRTPRAEPMFGAFDREGVLWVTDTPPVPRPSHAGVALGGGEAVPGPVAVTPEGTRAWTADGRIVDAGGDAPRPRARIAPGVDPMFERFVRLWARERRVVVVPADEETGEDAVVQLEIVPAPGGEALEPRPGRVEIEGSERAHALEDPAGFAVTWTAHLDRALLPPLGVVPLEERRAAGAGPSVVLPAGPLPESRRAREAVERREERGHRAIAGALALAAALFGALAAALNARRATSR